MFTGGHTPSTTLILTLTEWPPYTAPIREPTVSDGPFMGHMVRLDQRPGTTQLRELTGGRLRLKVLMGATPTPRPTTHGPEHQPRLHRATINIASGEIQLLPM